MDPLFDGSRRLGLSLFLPSRLYLNRFFRTFCLAAKTINTVPAVTEPNFFLFGIQGQTEPPALVNADTAARALFIKHFRWHHSLIHLSVKNTFPGQTHILPSSAGRSVQ